MAPSRAPLTEISSQTHNQRKMITRQQKYGKHNRNVAPLAPLWESSPSDDSKVEKDLPNLQAESFQVSDELSSPAKGPLGTEGDLEEDFKNLAIESLHTDDENRAPAFDSIKTPTPVNPSPPRRQQETRPRRSTRTEGLQPPAANAQPGLAVGSLLIHSNSGKAVSFDDFARRISNHYDIYKHAEGSYGDVYKLSKHSSTGRRSDRVQELGGCVFKIIPLCAKKGEGSRKFSQIDDVVREVKLLTRLDAVYGFTRFRDVHVVQGCYPTVFQRAFHNFIETGGQSQNKNPRKAFKQISAIIEMDDAGTDLELLMKPNIFEIHDILWSCAFVLAHGEDEVEFETRDGHIGNICRRAFVPGIPMGIPQDTVKYWREDQVRYLGLTGTRITLIDHTISRAKVQGTAMFSDLKATNFFRHMIDPTNNAPQYSPIGEWPIQDETVKNQEIRELALQHRAYFQMREMVRAASGSRKEDWALFVPKTNIVWLAYLLELMLRRHDGRDVAGSNEHCARAQTMMREKFLCVLEALNLSIEGDESGIDSAGKLLEVAVERSWLQRSEVERYAEMLENEP